MSRPELFSLSARTLKAFCLLVLFFSGLLLLLGKMPVAADEPEEPVRLQRIQSTSHGLLALLEGEKRVLMISGTPEEMGRAHGVLLADRFETMREKLLMVGAGYTALKSDWFPDRIKEVERRTRPYTPDRFYQEMAAVAEGAGRKPQEICELQAFPEMFHCSGIAVRGKAVPDGHVRHVRVLDYMRDIGLQSEACLMLFVPNDYHAWVSVSYSGLIGTVTAMNEKGLAIGEMGGEGEGKWDGLPMIFLLRRIMEECGTVDEALALMKSVPLTCDYYYILSDAQGQMAAVEALAGEKEPVRVLRPGERDERLPGVLDDVVYVSGPGTRIETLYKRLGDHYGKLDTPTLMEIIKRPVAMASNLHDVIFEPETQSLWFADAGPKTLACEERYFQVSMKELLDFFRQNEDKP